MLGTAFWPLSAEVIHQVKKKNILLILLVISLWETSFANYSYTYDYELEWRNRYAGDWTEVYFWNPILRKPFTYHTLEKQSRAKCPSYIFPTCFTTSDAVQIL